jgi:uncharacterized protein YecT (DUF1311 family)
MDVVRELLKSGADVNAGWLPPYAQEHLDFKRASVEINSVYKHLMSTLNPQQQSKLRKEERAWIKQRDAEADRMARSTSECCESAYKADYFDALAKLTRKRTEAEALYS